MNNNTITQKAESGNEIASNGSPFERLLLDIFEGAPRSFLRLDAGKEASFRRGISNTVNGLNETLPQAFCLSNFEVDTRDAYVAKTTFAKSMALPLGSLWNGPENFGPNYYVYDDLQKQLVAIWIASKPVRLETPEQRRTARKASAPIPYFSIQLIEGENAEFVDLVDAEALEHIAREGNWRIDEGFLEEDTELLKAIADLRDGNAAAHPNAKSCLSKKAQDILSKKRSQCKIKGPRSFAAFQEAIRLADQGYRVMPIHGVDKNGYCSCEYSRIKAARLAGEPFTPKCTQAGKHPKLPQWQNVASSDLLWIVEEWQKGPNKFGEANLGLVTGPESGVFVVDVDGPAGIACLKELEARHGPLPVTPTSETGGGGRHVFFRYPKGIELRNSVSRFGGEGSKIDIRAEAGFVVVPPSRHRSNNDYRWAEGSSPYEIDVAEAPEWVVSAVLAASKQNAQDAKSSDQSAKGRQRKSSQTRPGGRGEAGPKLQSALSKIGDGEGQTGFHDPIYRAAICFFHEEGDDADETHIKKIICQAVLEATVKDERPDVERYLSDTYLDEEIANARSWVIDHPASDIEHMLPSGFSVEGDFIVKLLGDDKRKVTICQVFDVIGWSRENGEDDWALVISFKNADARLVEISMPKGELFENSRSVRKTLGSKGFNLHTARWGDFEQIITQINTDRRIAAHSKPGWHGELFVCPSGKVVGPCSEEVVRYKHASDDCAPSGTLQGSIATMEAALKSGVPHWVIGVLSGGAASLVQLLQQDSCLIALTGETSRGKTTALSLGASWWGNPAPNKSGVLATLNGTENSFEAAIELSTGIGFFGDELRHLSGSSIQRLIFLIAGGRGKRRLNADASQKTVRSWENFSLLSGETGLAQAIHEDRTNPANGVMARCLEIDVSDAPVVSKEVVSAVVDYRQNYGHIGPAFVAHIQDHEDVSTLRARLEELVDILTESLRQDANEDESSLKRRVIRVAALCGLVGEIMQRAGLVSGQHDFIQALADIIEQQVDKVALSPAHKAIDALRTQLVSSPNVVRLDDVSDDDPQLFREAFAWIDDGFVYVRTDKIEELSGGALKSKAIISALRQEGVFVESGSEKNVAFTSVGKHRVNNYRIKVEFITTDSDWRLG